MKPSILISGATGHTGTVITRSLLNKGFHVIGTTRSQKTDDSHAGNGVDLYAVDLTDESAVRSFVHDLPDPGALHGAVLTAGGFAMGDFDKTNRDALQKMFAINFETAFYLVRELLPVLERNGGGQFILFGAGPGLSGGGGRDFVAYAMSKSLIFKLAELINVTGKKHNVHATVIVPGTIDTAANREAMPDADFSEWVSPQAIADTVLYLLSDAGKQVRETVIKLFAGA